MSTIELGYSHGINPCRHISFKKRVPSRTIERIRLRYMSYIFLLVYINTVNTPIYKFNITDQNDIHNALMRIWNTYFDFFLQRFTVYSTKCSLKFLGSCSLKRSKKCLEFVVISRLDIQRLWKIKIRTRNIEQIQ